MPLSDEARALIRLNLEQLQKGIRARLVVIGNLTAAQLAAINDNRRAYGHPPIIAEVVFIGRHVYESRVLRDGYSVEEVIDQIESAMDATAVVIATRYMTAIENPLARRDCYGNGVKDRAIFECSARHPRPELFSVVPKGDRIKPKKATHRVSSLFKSKRPDRVTDAFRLTNRSTSIVHVSSKGEETTQIALKAKEKGLLAGKVEMSPFSRPQENAC